MNNTRDANIIALFNNGNGTAPAEIARQLNISRERVRQVLVANGIDAGKHRSTGMAAAQQAVVDQIKLTPLATDKELADLIGVPEPTVNHYRRKLGIKRDRDATFYKARAKARFWTHIDITANPTECWNWTGYTNKTLGYPHTRAISKSRRSQVIVWILTTGNQPTQNISTTCDNPLCCNFNHLADVPFSEVIAKRERAYKRRAGL